jgi:hypothetical protein
MSILLQETHTFCARNVGAHVQCTSLECQRYEKQDKKSDSHAAKKGAVFLTVSPNLMTFLVLPDPTPYSESELLSS